MAVAQPNHLLVFGESSGTSITNYGTISTVYTIGGGTSPTDYAWNTNADPALSYLETKQEDTANNPGMSTAATAPSGVLNTINLAIKFQPTTTAGAGTHFLLYSDKGAFVYIQNTAGTYSLFLEFRDVFTQGATYTVATGLSYGVDHILVASIDVTTNTASQPRYKLDGNAVVTPTAFNLDNSFGTEWPVISRGFINTGEGVKSRYYWMAYQRGGTAWTSSDLDSIYASPSFITGWPGGGATGVSKTTRLTMLGVG